MDQETHDKLDRCRADPVHFISQYVKTYDATAKDWIRLDLWPAQQEIVVSLESAMLSIMLKARQLGCTTVVLAYVLWVMLFRPIATVLLFSRRDDEAVDLLDFRLKGMHRRLPPWMRSDPFNEDNDHEWQLANGSRALAFGRVGGDSYTATIAVIDEADLIPELAKLMQSVKPTIDAGGKLVLLSRPDKSKPESPFKKIYRAACEPGSDWHPIFLPWNARPDRDATWYTAQSKDVLARTGSLDDLYEQYPATAEEALSARSLDKRLPPAWLKSCYEPLPALPSTDAAPALLQLAIYRYPEPGRSYIIGADPAEGNPTSDPSALSVMDRESGEQVADLAGQFEPATFASIINTVGIYYNRAAVMPERNNHGHAVILWLRDNSQLHILAGTDGKPGWMTTTASKSILYDTAGESLRDGTVTVHGFSTFLELGSIEGATLRSPDGQTDDRAVAFVLCVVACRRRIDPQRVLDALVAARAPLAIASPTEDLPSLPGVGAIEYVRTFGEFHVMLTTKAGKRSVFGSQKREETMVAAQLVGLPVTEDMTLTPERRAAIAAAVERKRKEYGA